MAIRRKRPRLEPGIPRASAVTVTHADGTTTSQPPLTKREANTVIQRGKRRPRST